MMDSKTRLFVATMLFAVGMLTYGHPQPVVTPPPFTAQNPTLGTLPSYNDAYANWKVAGLALIGGIPNRTTQCGATVNPVGSGTPPFTNDDAQNINNAITACTAGQVVQLGSGVFQLDLSEQITLSKGVTLRGTGSCTNGSSPYCSTVIQYRNGAWPTYNPSAECGTTTGVPPLGTAPGSFVACPSGNPLVVVSPPFPSNFLGWGATSGATNCQIGGAANPTTNGCGTLLAADVSKGAIKVQVADTSNFSVGDWVMIDDNPLYTTQTNPLFAQFIMMAGDMVGPPSTTVSATPDEFSTSPTPVTPRTENVDQDCSYSMCTARLNEEIKLISAIGVGPCPGLNCTLTFDTPLSMDKRQSNSHDGRVYWLTGCGCGSGPTPPARVPFLAQAGIENITLARAVNTPLVFQMCAYCWAKNVETSYWIKGVSIQYSGRVQVESSFLHDCVDCEPNGNEYPISIEAGSTEPLVVNNIMVFGGKGMVGRAAAASVVAYNYGDKTFYQQSSTGNWFLDMGINGSHEGGTHHFLFEGNWTPNCDGDQTHGAAAYHTFFRNHCTGFRSNFDDPSNPSLHVSDINGVGYCGAENCGAGNPLAPNRLRAFGPMSYNNWYAFVGNVGGLSGQSTTGKGWIYSARTAGNRGTGSVHPMTDKAIWQSGWTGQDPGNCCNYVTDPNLDGTNTPQLIHIHRNYDYVTNLIFEDAAGYSLALPNSYYLAGRPAFFTGASCIYPWPWVTPAGASPLPPPTGPGACSTLASLPAKARYDAGTPFAQP